jgi:hypothetical protein
MHFSSSRWVPTCVFLLTLFFGRVDAGAEPIAALTPGVIVIGFVGGRVHHDNAIHKEVQLAAHLRHTYPTGLQAEIFENHQGRQARLAILKLLDADRNGSLSNEEKQAARIVLYGHSWGASEAVTLARSLEKDGVPVLLTIQVDSVSKFGENDRFIPANVARAVNFYQLDGLLHGQQKILAIDGSRTKILGNYRFDYKANQVKCDGYPWYAQLFMKPHIEIESDPKVWNQVESLIQEEVAAPPETR